MTHSKTKTQNPKFSLPRYDRYKDSGVEWLPPTTLRLCRTLYLAYPEIRQTLSGEMEKGLMMSQLGIQQTLSVVSEKGAPQTSAESTRPGFAPPVGQLLEQLTFSHFVELLRIEDPLQRAFYEMECVECGWSVPSYEGRGVKARSRFAQKLQNMA